MEVASGMLFLVLLLAVAGLLVSAFLVHMAATFSGVPNATFGKAVKAVIANAVVSLVVSMLFSIIPLAGTLLGMIISLAATLWVFMKIYAVGWGQALLLWVMQWVVLFLVFFGVATLMGMSILAL